MAQSDAQGFLIARKIAWTAARYYRSIEHSYGVSIASTYTNCRLFEDRSQGIRIESRIAAYQHDQKIFFDAATQSLSDIMSKLDVSKSTTGQTRPYSLQGSSREQSDRNVRLLDYGPSRVAQATWATIRYLGGPGNSFHIVSAGVMSGRSAANFVSLLSTVSLGLSP